MDIKKCKQEYCNWNVCMYYNGPPLDCDLNINRNPQPPQAEGESLSKEDHKTAHDIIWGALVDAEAPLTDSLKWAMDILKPQ